MASLPPTAGAAARSHYELQARQATRIQLQGSNGYRIGVSLNSHGYFILKTRKGGAEAVYVIEGTRVEPDRVKANLGAFGKVDVRFTPSGRTRRLPGYSNCDGPGPVVQEGLVRGLIRFSGEGGYTAVRAHRAKAEVFSLARQRCRHRARTRSKRAEEPTANFWAYSRQSHFFAELYSSRPRSRQVVFTGRGLSRRGRITVIRSVSAAADRSSFRFPEGMANPEHVVVAPPAPFSGTATFQRTPESTFAWEGPLSIVFPGTETYGLAGPQFDTQLCVPRGCISQFPAGNVRF